MSREDEMSLLMMINKVQSPEDLREFLEIRHDKIERILEKTPERILTIIADTIWALCMKMNVPTKEAEECVKRVKERQMGYLFENMEKMDIQAERRNTEEARKKLKEYQQEAEEKLGRYQQEAEKKLDRYQQEAKEERDRYQQEAKEELERYQQEAEEAKRRHIEDIIAVAKEYGADKPSIVEKVIEKCSLDRKEAEEVIEQYWIY